VSIELRCEGCGKMLRAPRGAAGKRKKCPACGHELYVPPPEDEVEELPLAPEDADERRREARLQAERRRLDRALAREDAEPPEPVTKPGGSDRPWVPAGEADAEATVLTFLLAMRDSDLTRAEEAVALLRRRRSETLKAVDRLAVDQIPPAEMAGVPPAVYQGFLKNLTSQLQP